MMLLLLTLLLLKISLMLLTLLLLMMSLLLSPCLSPAPREPRVVVNHKKMSETTKEWLRSLECEVRGAIR